jgi:hypothetical protein
MERDAAVERWFRKEVVAGHKEYLADPSKGVPRMRSSNASTCSAQGSVRLIQVMFTPFAARHFDSLHEYITKHASESRADDYVGRAA